MNPRMIDDGEVEVAVTFEMGPEPTEKEIADTLTAIENMPTEGDWPE